MQRKVMFSAVLTLAVFAVAGFACMSTASDSKVDTRERVVTDMNSYCHSCHISQKDNDYVFSTYRK